MWTVDTDALAAVGSSTLAARLLEEATDTGGGGGDDYIAPSPPAGDDGSGGAAIPGFSIDSLVFLKHFHLSCFKSDIRL